MVKITFSLVLSLQEQHLCIHHSLVYFPYFEKMKSLRDHLAVCAPHHNVVMQQLSKHMPTAMHTHTTEELLDVAFSMPHVSVPNNIYSETKVGDYFSELLVL
jgi:hypothetical protein